ncbi:MAG TPA: NDP-sugar synthase [Actinomycetes bacterium]|nr:NDP-sugar synthase [Actinomycetes bacterium]
MGAGPAARPGTEVVGFCLAAGAGSRLAPLTRRVPKPLLAPAGRPLVDLACEALLVAGAGRVVVNAHHGADLLAAHLDGRAWRAAGESAWRAAGSGSRAWRAAGDPAGCQVVREPELLGTGGGLGNARRLGLLGRGIVLVTCADVVAHPADMAELAALLERSGAQLAAGLVPARDDPLPFRLDATGRIVPDPAGGWASAGVYAVRAAALDAVPPGRSTLAESVLEPLCQRGQAQGWPLRHPWADAGTLGRLLGVSARLLAGCWPYRLPPGRLLPAGRDRGPVLVVDGSVLAPGAVVAGPGVLDRGSRIEHGAVITRVVVGPGAVVGTGATVTGSVLGPGATVEPGATVTAALLPR